MRIDIASPLYPPEVASAAVYAKELARRFARNHAVTVVAYAHLPEEVPGVRVVSIEKRQSRLRRLLAFRRVFDDAVSDADAVLAVNGASVELPILLAPPRRLPLIYCVADTAAHERAGLIERIAFARAEAVIKSIPPPRPEILPFAPEPTAARAAYEAAWTEHVRTLETLITRHD